MPKLIIEIRLNITSDAIQVESVIQEEEIPKPVSNALEPCIEDLDEFKPITLLLPDTTPTPYEFIRARTLQEMQRCAGVSVD
ncbi:MAG: hypothetical protein EHM41_00110 [Chloroflexi bacterium]|nr:MAG: hypothetical protein EHM41_00110 [Chloroflexota bacterium]